MMMKRSIGMEGLVECRANYIPLTPISFLERATRIFPDKTCMIYGDVTLTWKATLQRCLKLASALTSLGLCYGDFVATLAPNSPEVYELHFGVPLAGGVLATLNPKLDANTLSFLLQELDARFIFLGHQQIEVTLKALKLLDKKTTNTSSLVLINLDQQQESRLSYIDAELHSSMSHYYYYNELLDMGHIMDYDPFWVPKHECDPILVSYTSGSTGNPKGVVYSHRSTYLNTLGEIFRSDLKEGIVFLWTADMFRANGWGFTWAIAALGGTNVCLGNMNGNAILDSISMHGITHLSGHSKILVAILEEKSGKSLPHKVYAHIAGVLPPYDMATKIEEMGFELVFRYGMTEVLGPPVKIFWKNDDAQSCNIVMDNIMEEFDVKNPSTMKSVPYDGETIGEIMFRGNTLMMGYLKAPNETKRAFKEGWFRTGDLAVRRKDGCILLKDRAKDVIVNKGKCISSLEIEAVILGHPKVLETAVVGMPYNNGTSGEVPCAFVKLKAGMDANEEEIINFCSNKLPKLMIPKVVIFGDLAFNSTGKVQKFVLREEALQKFMHINNSHEA